MMKEKHHKKIELVVNILVKSLKCGNDWRKKHWLCRTIILLLIFSLPIYEFFSGDYIMVRLVDFACQAIYNCSIPPCENKLCQYYKTLEKKSLQRQIVNFADKNCDSMLSYDEKQALTIKGIDIAEILKPAIKANLDDLASFAKQLSLIPASYSCKEVRLRSFYAAQGETVRFFSPLQNEVNKLLYPPRQFFMPVYDKFQIEEIIIQNGRYDKLDWCSNPYDRFISKKFWVAGLSAFFYEIKSLISPLCTNILWFSASMFFAACAASFIEKQPIQKIFASLCGLIFFFVILIFNGQIRAIPELRFDLTAITYSEKICKNFYVFVGMAILSVIAGLCGAKLANAFNALDSRKRQVLLLMLGGISLLLWGCNFPAFLFYNSPNLYLFEGGPGQWCVPYKIGFYNFECETVNFSALGAASGLLIFSTWVYFKNRLLCRVRKNDGTEVR